MTSFLVELDENLSGVFEEAALEETAKKERCSKSEVIRRALRGPAQLPGRARKGSSMNERTRRRLEAAGARVVTVKEFLDLSDADMTFIEMRAALAKKAGRDLIDACRRVALWRLDGHRK